MCHESVGMEVSVHTVYRLVPSWTLYSPGYFGVSQSIFFLNVTQGATADDVPVPSTEVNSVRVGVSECVCVCIFFVCSLHIVFQFCVCVCVCTLERNHCITVCVLFFIILIIMCLCMKLCFWLPALCSAAGVADGNVATPRLTDSH